MTISRSSLYRDTPLCIYFISLATVIEAFTVQNINFLFIGLSTLALAFIVVYNVKSLPKPRNQYLLLLFIFMTVVSLWNYETSRWTGLAYSFFFIFTFILFSQFYAQFLTVKRFRTLLKIVFYLYLAGLIAGQLDYYFDAFAPFNSIINYVRGSFGVVQEKDGLRFFSLSSEPSYAAFMVVTIFYGYIKLDPKKSNLYSRENLFMLIILLYMIFMFKSAYGVILLGLVALEYVGLSSAVLVVITLVVSLSIFLTVTEFEIKALTRVINLVQKLDVSDPHSLYAIDFTAYYRVAPTLHFIEMADLTDFSFLVGHGPGASRLYVVPEIYGGYIGGEFLGGFIPAFFYDYGVIGGLMVLVFLYQQVPSLVSFQSAVLVLMLLNANFNTQLFWFIVLNFHLIKHYRGVERPQPVTHIPALA